MTNQALYNACEFAKLAADFSYAPADQGTMQTAQQVNVPVPAPAPTDMHVPVEPKKPAPEAGSQPVEGMTDNSTYNPASPGSSVYADTSEALAIAEAKEEAARLLMKHASAIREMVAASKK